MPLQEGQHLGPYQIIGPIGQGGMASVYKAYHARLDRYVAVKIMHQMLLEDPTFQTRFEREAQIVARLEHPNIVPVYDYNELENQPYLVMKYIEGRTLKNLLSAGPLSPEHILAVMTPVASALTYAHQRGVIHRDIKPSNIVLDKDEMPYITDFGLARIAQMGESTMSQDMILGTPQYISPEQARGEKNLDARTDIYSFGVVLYEMVVGRVPFNADTPYSIVHDHIYSRLPMPSSLNPAVPPAVETVLVKALAKNPADRYATANDLINDLRAATTASGAASFVPDQLITPQPVPAVDDNSPTVIESTPPQFASPVSDDAPSRPVTPRKSAKFITIPSPIAPTGSSPRPYRAERRFDTAGKIEIDLGTVGQKVESGLKKMPGLVTEIMTSMKEAAKNSQPSEEERIRRRVEKRFRERRRFQRRLISFVTLNLIFWQLWELGLKQVLMTFIQNTPSLPSDLVQFVNLPWPVIFAVVGAIGVLTHAIGYYTRYGPGAEAREREVERELARRRQMTAEPAYIEKPKNDRRVRLTDDGELEDVPDDVQSIVEKRKRDWS
jgi:serine/threonine-protein kinase